MISYLPVTFYLCASSYSNSHGAQIKKKKKYKKQEFLKNSLKTRIVARFGHYDSLPTKSHPQVKFFFFFCCAHRKRSTFLLCKHGNKNETKSNFFQYFFKQIPIGQCACITHKHTPQISNHIILYTLPQHIPRKCFIFRLISISYISNDYACPTVGETLYFCSKYFFYISELLNPSRVAKFEAAFSVGDIHRIMTNLKALTLLFGWINKL